MVQIRLTEIFLVIKKSRLIVSGLGFIIICFYFVRCLMKIDSVPKALHPRGAGLTASRNYQTQQKSGLGLHTGGAVDKGKTGKRSPAVLVQTLNPQS